MCRTMLSSFVQQGESKPMIEYVQKLMSHESFQKKYERICTQYTERTADIKQYLPKTVILDKHALVEKSK